MNTRIPTLEECLVAAGGTKYLLVREGAFSEIPGILDRYFADGKKSVIACFSDTNTFKAAGKELLDIVHTKGISSSSYVFNEGIHADYDHVTTIKNELKTALQKLPSKDHILVPVAAGSGTINDLVKRAADELALSYLCVPTAASVDGYTAYGAALLYDGFKQTMSCKAPLAVVADSEILAKAPAYLSSSGFGDLAGKIIAGSDWIIADWIFNLDGKGNMASGIDPIESTAWAMVQNPLKNNLSASVHAARGDKDAVRILFEALGITGFALQYMKDSRAVSGCEHMWSHVWEMENLCMNGIPVTHGHKVVMGTLAASAFTECFFSEKPQFSKDIPLWAEREASIQKAFSGLQHILPSVLKTAREKFMDKRDNLIQLREGILDSFDALKKAVFEKLPPHAELRSLLEEAGCPVIPREVNLSGKQIINSAIKAQMIRKRFTVLDLAFELGVFDKVLKKMESSEYFN